MLLSLGSSYDVQVVGYHRGKSRTVKKKVLGSFITTTDSYRIKEPGRTVRKKVFGSFITQRDSYCPKELSIGQTGSCQAAPNDSQGFGSQQSWVYSLPGLIGKPDKTTCPLIIPL